MDKHKVIVVGAGVGGLVAALLLAARGVQVTLVERMQGPGGKLRAATVGNAEVDAGPTVFTLRPIFEDIFARAGTSLSSHLTLQPARILARHDWPDGARLDLYVDIEESAEAIREMAGPDEAAGYVAFCARARAIYEVLETSFIQASEPSLPGLIRSSGLSGLPGLLRISPFQTLWKMLGQYFKDPRLRQLFGRYSTYCGSSPFQAPATLMLVSHVEQEGVWLVDGGMVRVATAIADLATRLGADLRYGDEVAEIEVTNGRVSGAVLASGDRLAADAVVVNADVAAVASGMFGAAAKGAVPPARIEDRSLSAVTVELVANTKGFPLVRHNVFFSSDYQGEFDAILRRSTVPDEPTIYVCAQDRDDHSGHGPGAPERLLCLINAPPVGDAHTFSPAEIERCEDKIFSHLERRGLHVDRASGAKCVTTPSEFARRFPATGGAIYGRASHGWQASFKRPGCRTRMPGLYLAGGSVHPGPGVPMAALSGRMAAECLLADYASIRR